MPEPDPMGAHVEIVEPYTTNRGQADLALGIGTAQGLLGRLPCIKPRRVRINGTDVGLIQRGSIVVDVGDDFADAGNRPATVTLTLLVKSVEIKAE